MSETDRLVAAAADYPVRFVGPYAAAPGRPRTRVAIVACMDARIDVFSLFGLEPGDAHVIRNAGGLVTEDALRSLAISQRALGTEEVILVHHTRCGMQGLDDEALARDLEAATGRRPSWSAGGFADPAEDVRRSKAIIEADPFIPSKQVRGFVFDVNSGVLEEI
ncbi:MAG TPA: carbonic anhydrase [Acidimicrobiales bacterium]|jgi:carbonic anhydrase|nr:carbonic anhydrase [Acidimicrobiales bacterium]